jgi:hypothetical protein
MYDDLLHIARLQGKKKRLSQKYRTDMISTECISSLSADFKKGCQMLS